jgi:probable F420-dependent oxidoreductase
VKVRIGVSAGAGGPLDAGAFADLVDGLESCGFDSLWVPEVLTGASFDPLGALAFAAGRARRLKFGSHLVAPGRTPARLAKELATLDRLSAGRLLLTFVIGLPDGPELSAGGVARDERTARLEELLPLLRRLWSGETVTHHGRFYDLDEVAVLPTPHQSPLEVWFGGMQPAALRRCGRLADGWIPGLVPVEQAVAAKARIDEAAAEAGRVVDPEHFGANLLYTHGRLSDEDRARLQARYRDRPIDELVPEGLDGLAGHIERWVAAGFSKFVVRPVAPPADWARELDLLATAVLPLQV